MHNILFYFIQDGRYTDVTISTDDGKFQCHKMVLSACSPYLESLMDTTSCESPVIFLTGVKAGIFLQLLKYMYVGEVQVEIQDVEDIFEHASYLKIR